VQHTVISPRRRALLGHTSNRPWVGGGSVFGVGGGDVFEIASQSIPVDLGAGHNGKAWKRCMNQGACVTVLMLCDGPLPSLREAVLSVLKQPECLELVLVIDGSTSGVLESIGDLPAGKSCLRLLESSVECPAESVNDHLLGLRGTFIALLYPTDFWLPGSLARAVQVLAMHPEWLMVCGDRKEVDGLSRLFPLQHGQAALLRSQTLGSDFRLSLSGVVFRRSMAVLLNVYRPAMRSMFDFDFLQSALSIFSSRIGYLPHLQCCAFSYPRFVANGYRRQLALEATAMLAGQFGAAPASCLHNYALELQLGLAGLPNGVGAQEHLADIAELAAPLLEPQALREFRQSWHLDLDKVPTQLLAEQHAASLKLQHLLPVQFLQAEHSELLLDAPGPPSGPHLRLQQAVHRFSRAYPLLQGASAPASLVPFLERPFGVNLIGHAFEVFGIGEDIRMAASALQAAGVPCAVIYQPAANGSTCTDHSLEPLLCTDPSGGPYAFNLVCMAAPSQARWLLQGGLDALRERFTLTAWPWETQQWPKAWLPLLEVADELWPSSSFTAAALQAPAAAAALPLQVMPMAAAIPDPDRFCNPTARRAARARHDLPADVVLFGYSFDLNSSAIRKNPMGALEAFQLAFPLRELLALFGREINSHPLSNQVALMIKALPPQSHSPEWHWLQLRAAEDPRIHLVVASLERDELLALYGCCDVFLSLHRSEGFGRGMAEALQLGLDVISTAYGGNSDFCTGPLAHPVRFQTVQIPRGAYPCADGHFWAEPDLGHAAALMQQVALRRRGLDSDPPATATVDPSRDPDVLATYRGRFSHATAGLRYRARLEALWSQRYALANQLKWKVDTPV
jgi:hypothetical protein